MVQLDFKNDYICTYKNVLSEDQCQHLIDKFEDSQHQQSKTNLKNHMSFSNNKFSASSSKLSFESSYSLPGFLKNPYIKNKKFKAKYPIFEKKIKVPKNGNPTDILENKMEIMILHHLICLFHFQFINTFVLIYLE